MTLGGRVAIEGGLVASQANVVSWRGAFDRRVNLMVDGRATGSLKVEDANGLPVRGTEELSAEFRKPGWYDVVIPATADLVPGTTYTFEFALQSR